MSLADFAADRETRLGARAHVQLLQARFVGGYSDTAAAFRSLFPRSVNVDRVAKRYTRGSVPAGGTPPDSWAAPLAVQAQMFAGDFTQALRPATVLGKLAFTPAPCSNAPLPVFTSGMSPAVWVGQGKAAPLSSAAIARTTLPPYKLVSACMTTTELLRDADVNATALLETDLRASVIEGRDRALLNPLLNEVPFERPASITNGVDPIPIGGNDIAAITTAAQAALGRLLAAGSDLSHVALITSQAAGLYLSGLRDPSGALGFPGAGPLGGTLLGMPLICSASCGPQLVAVDARNLVVADAGITTDTFSEGDVEFVVPPTGDALAPSGMTERISLFQTNGAVLRSLDYVSWKMIRADCVAVVSGFPEASTELVLTGKLRRPS